MLLTLTAFSGPLAAAKLQATAPQTHLDWGGAHLHRVVFTPDETDKAKPFLPFRQMASDKPEKLWAWLDATNKRTGADFIAIPLNSNVSWTKMIQVEDSETHPALSATDEFADHDQSGCADELE